MSQSHPAEDNRRRRGIIILLASVLAGLAVSFASASVIISSNGPKDSDAVKNGQQTVVEAGELIGYGG